MKQIPTITPHDQLYGRLNSVSFAILDPKNNYHSLEQMAEIYSFLHGNDMTQSVADLVAFSPARLLKHEIIIALTTKVKIKNLSEDLYQKFHIIEALIDIEKFAAFGDNLRQEKLKSAEGIQGLIDVAEYSNELLRLRAKEIVAEAINISGLEGITEYEAADRVIFTVNGAIASGKGGLEKMIKQRTQEWDSVAKVNGDSYKLLLNSDYIDEKYSEKLSLFSQLVQDEITIIGKEINQRFYQHLAQTGKAANIYFDKAMLNDFAVDLACSKGGRIEGMLVSLSAEEAFKRSELRGEATGRYEDTKMILEAHATIATRFIKFLMQHQSKSIFYEVFDNEVSLTKIAIIDLSIKEVRICDKINFSKFLNKSNLDVENSLIQNDFIYNNSNSAEILMSGIVDAGYEITDYCY